MIRIYARSILLLLIGSMAGSIPSITLADGPSDVVSPMEVARAGLDIAWTTQAEIGAADQIKFAYLHVSNTRASVYFEIYVGNELRTSFATLDRDALGNRLGYERAKEMADLAQETTEQEVAASLADKGMPQAEFAELTMGTTPEAIEKRKKFLEEHQQTVEVRKYVEPRMTLYVLNGRNVLQSFDAETGSLHWSTQVGPREGSTMGIAANDAMVAVINGLRIYCIEAVQGRILWNRRCDGAPSAEPAMSHTHIFAPLMDGRLQSFDIASDGLDTRFYVSQGEISAQPLVTGRTVSWPTTAGHYNVAYFDEIGSIKYRIKTNGPIVTTPARLGRVLFVASMDGYVYAIDEVTGSIFWEFSTGSSISQPPLALGDSVYFVTDNEELFKVDSQTGRTPASWPKSIPGIHRLVGAAEPYIYVEDTANNLAVIRDDNGGLENTIRVGEGVHLLNSQTDRIFLISKSGRMQCLHQTSHPHPVFHTPVSESISSMETSGVAPKQTWRTRKATQLNEQIRNPFETKEELSQDPFVATEPVYKNPFLEETDGEVNPFELQEDGSPIPEEQPAENQPKPNAAPDAAPDAAPAKDQPPAKSDDPFGGG